MYVCSASAFNKDIGSWNTAKVTDMSSMFHVRFCVQPRHWELEHSESEEYAYMFFQASSFNHDIGSWNTAQVGSMHYMFYQAIYFNHDISSWTGSAATSAQKDMFYDASAFRKKFSCTNAVNGPASSCILK